MPSELKWMTPRIRFIFMHFSSVKLVNSKDLSHPQWPWAVFHCTPIINNLLLLLVQKSISLHSFLPLLALNVKFVMKGENSGPLYLHYYTHFVHLL